MNNKILDIKNISANYYTPSSETKALRNINFSVNKGEFVSIVGPSGCGKSTLLSIIAKLIKPSEGEILINNTPLKNSSISIGYMLQKDCLFEWRTVWENVILGLEIQNNLTNENIEYIEFLLEKYDLINFKDYNPSQLSGGMRQRTALIRTLALKPEILLLDEPFSALDYQSRLFVSDEIANIIRKEQKTALLVTHDISEAISISNKVIVFSKRPAEVKSIYNINLTNKDNSPLSTRASKEFNDYFSCIWKELDINE